MFNINKDQFFKEMKYRSERPLFPNAYQLGVEKSSNGDYFYVLADINGVPLSKEEHKALCKGILNYINCPDHVLGGDHDE